MVALSIYFKITCFVNSVLINCYFQVNLQDVPFKKSRKEKTKVFNDRYYQKKNKKTSLPETNYKA